MGSPKFSTFIVGLIFVSALATVLGLMMADFSTNYDVSYDDNYSPDVISEIDELSNLTTSVRESTVSDTDDPGNIISQTVDILGDLFQSGYTTLKTVFQSFTVFRTMTDSGLSKIGLGSTESVVRTAIIASIMILLTVGVIVSALVRKNV